MTRMARAWWIVAAGMVLFFLVPLLGYAARRLGVGLGFRFLTVHGIPLSVMPGMAVVAYGLVRVSAVLLRP